MRFLIIIALLLFQCSCKPVQPVASQVTNELHKEEPQIGFYYFEAIKNSNDIIQISLTKQKIVKGKLKKVFTSEISPTKWMNNHWIVTFLDADQKNVIQLQIANPLQEEVEFINEEGGFKKRTIYHDKRIFVIRVPSSNSIKTITFEKINKENNTYKPVFIDQIQQ